MEHKINTGGQSVTITDNQNLLELSDLFESDVVEIEDLPAETVNELQLLREFGF